MEKIHFPREIFSIFETKYKIDNARTIMYYEDNHYVCIPKLLFKFELSEGQEIYQKIKKCVESFKGNLEWTLLIDNENLRRYKILIPMLYADCGYESEEIKFFGEAIYKDTCDKAILDIPNLAKYLEKELFS